MNFYDIEFVTYYRKYEKLTEATDTIYPAKTQSYLAVTPEVVYNNNISLEPCDAIEAMVNAGDAIIMSPAGYEVKVQFPVQSIIDKYNSDTEDALGKINSLSLEIPAENITNLYDNLNVLKETISHKDLAVIRFSILFVSTVIF